jgi:hypothetical protein
MNQVTRSENEFGDCQLSGKYEYTFHPAAKLTLQIFNTKTMSSAFFTAQETLALLDYLAQHQSQIEAVATEDDK